jgi:hypothetical protein
MTVHYKEENVREISALLLGPPGTPYAFGLYEVSVHDTEDRTICRVRFTLTGFLVHLLHSQR